MKLYLLFDCDYLCHRAEYAMGGLTFRGDNTGVIFGFFAMVFDLINQFQTPHVVFCFDSRKSKRKKLYPQYKANRNQKELTPEEVADRIAYRKQIKSLRRVYLPQLGFRNVRHQVGYESDDHLAAAAYELATKDDTKVYIVTADEDLYQCIREKVYVYHPQKQVLIGPKTFKKTYGIIPEAWPSVKAIAGCHSDNIQGIKGVGEKTCLKYMLGDLPKQSVKSIRIATMLPKVLKQNLRLVVLPLNGTAPFTMQRDHVKRKHWKQCCEELGIRKLTLPPVLLEK